MIGFLKNHVYRIGSRKSYTITSLLMTVGSICLALFFTANLSMNPRIAVVTQGSTADFQTADLNITVLEKEPPLSQLVSGKYDAVIIQQEDGHYNVKTIKNADFEKVVGEMVKDPKGSAPGIEEMRGVGTNMIGFLLLFLLLQSVLFMFTLADDRERKQIERIVAAPVSFTKYLFSHFICTFTVVFVPAYSVLFVLKVILGVEIGFSLFQYAAFLGMICAFGTAFSMLMNSLVKGAETANMMGSVMVLLTTILSGNFYAFDKGNEFLEKVIWIFPQKSILSFVQGIEGGRSGLEMVPQLSYPLALTLLFFIVAMIKIKKEYVLREN